MSHDTTSTATDRTPVQVDAIAPISDEDRAAVDFALQNGREYAKSIALKLNRPQSPHPDLVGLELLEVGTPRYVGPMLVCQAFGAGVTVANGHFRPWSDDEQPTFLRALRVLGEEAFPDADWSGLDRILAAGGWVDDVIRFVQTPMEATLPFDDASFDCVVSNGILAKTDARGLIEELGRVTRSAGFGFHQIDLRASRDPQRPLELLTLSDDAWAAHLKENGYASGNCVRPSEFVHLFRVAGFRVENFGPNMFADDAYIKDLRPRLAPAYQAMTDEDLQVTSGRFYLRRIRDEQVKGEVDYALNVATEYLDLIRHMEGSSDVAGKRILELGPGLNFGSMVVLQALGAEVAVLDKYMADWDEGYHPRFYSFLIDEGRTRLPDADWSGVQRIIDADNHLNDVIEMDTTDLASPPGDLPDASFDIIVSNAVLEHVGDVKQTAIELARLTKPGGIGIHQVDFRDHRNFDLPLGFLTVDDDEYRDIFDSSNNGNGNRVRPRQMGRDFEIAGFQITGFDANILADPSHVQDVRPHLQPQYAYMSDEELREVSGRFFVRRESDEPNNTNSDENVTTAPTGAPASGDDVTANDSPLEDAAEYAVTNGFQYAWMIAQHFGREFDPIPDLHDLRIIEIGPGRDWGSMLVCTVLGAEVAVLDKYLAHWDNDYHPRVYTRIRERMAERVPNGRFDHLDRVITDNMHSTHAIASKHYDLSSPPSPFPAASFDATVSNAVLEHVGDTRRAAAELARLTRPGGVGIHQVDFRDHSNFDYPLEFLTIPDRLYVRVFGRSSNQSGNRVRCHELAEDFAATGFDVTEVRTNMLAPVEYVEGLRPKMQPRFASMTTEQLQAVSARLFLTRTDAPANPEWLTPAKRGLWSRLTKG